MFILASGMIVMGMFAAYVRDWWGVPGYAENGPEKNVVIV